MRNDLLKDVLRVTLVVGFFIIVLSVLHYDTVREALTRVDVARQTMATEEAQLGDVGARVLFVLLAGIAVGAGLPRLYASTFAGALFGPVEGVLLALCSSVLGAAICYQLGRSLLGSTVRRRLGGKLAFYREQCRKDPFWWVLFGRLMPFANSTLMSLLCGACRVPVGPFLLASAIGFLPLTIAFALLGSGGANRSGLQLGFAAAIMIAAILAKRWIAARRRDAGFDSRDEPAA